MTPDDDGRRPARILLVVAVAPALPVVVLTSRDDRRTAG